MQITSIVPLILEKKIKRTKTLSFFIWVMPSLHCLEVYFPLLVLYLFLFLFLSTSILSLSMTMIFSTKKWYSYIEMVNITFCISKFLFWSCGCDLLLTISFLWLGIIRYKNKKIAISNGIKFFTDDLISISTQNNLATNRWNCQLQILSGD
jgi:hypothetical protein